MSYIVIFTKMYQYFIFMYSYYLTETTLAINFFKLFFLVDGTFREYVNSVCFKDCSSAWRRKSRMFRRASQICLRFILMWIMVLPLDLGHVHTNMFSFENAYFSLRFGLPSTLRWHFCQGKRHFRIVVWTVKTEAYENDAC